MTAGGMSWGNQRLEEISGLWGVGRIGRMWEGLRHVLGYKRDSGET